MEEFRGVCNKCGCDNIVFGDISKEGISFQCEACKNEMLVKNKLVVE